MARATCWPWNREGCSRPIRTSAKRNSAGWWSASSIAARATRRTPTALAPSPPPRSTACRWIRPARASAAPSRRASLRPANISTRFSTPKAGCALPMISIRTKASGHLVAAAARCGWPPSIRATITASRFRRLMVRKCKSVLWEVTRTGRLWRTRCTTRPTRPICTRRRTAKTSSAAPRATKSGWKTAAAKNTCAPIARMASPGWIWAIWWPVSTKATTPNAAMALN
ncbi:hypothetical protein WG78_19090 [Amantichitinum ursilacus]|uniref:Uncharacterized protein n=1 Tax=Amantichitinum ursilacus TaxID=857265 RepID=A0A0N0GL97_9NEIS|nr:hypothetical protein WG78_19090 [Amantichitinum ursilacus]